MAVKRKPVHKCVQVQNIAHINELLVGNHEPENGVVYKMIGAIKDIKAIKDDITEIKDSIKEAIQASGKAIHAIESYKAETVSFEQGQKDRDERQRIADDLTAKNRRDKWQRRVWVIMAMIGLIGLGVNIYFNITKSKQTNTKIQTGFDNIGTPVIVNPRGETVGLTHGYKIKMWPRDFMTDTTKQDTTKQDTIK